MGASKNEKQRHLAGSVCIACNSWFPGCEFKYNVGGRDNFKKKKKEKEKQQARSFITQYIQKLKFQDFEWIFKYHSTC